MKWLIIRARAPFGAGQDRIVSQLEAPDKRTAEAYVNDAVNRKLLPPGCCVVSAVEYDTFNCHRPQKPKPRRGWGRSF